MWYDYSRFCAKSTLDGSITNQPSYVALQCVYMKLCSAPHDMAFDGKLNSRNEFTWQRIEQSIQEWMGEKYRPIQQWQLESFPRRTSYQCCCKHHCHEVKELSEFQFSNQKAPYTSVFSMYSRLEVIFRLGLACECFSFFLVEDVQRSSADNTSGISKSLGDIGSRYKGRCRNKGAASNNEKCDEGAERLHGGYGISQTKTMRVWVDWFATMSCQAVVCCDSCRFVTMSGATD